ncbi:DUF1254 domain-containing protein [Mesorhizobium sp. B3-1-3]|uniref:DUF1254 domain-containing protein n=1 Tax=unclassified Mesorhizobium TaxID=325217 RepID=UPI00112DB523|nr:MULTISPECIES: DUF1254 domain-containing protein [unclassified Mesorhizobium]TPI68093.1 DUF1254 domain-containing protein [Mesorhizobium sp. B3-1-8]TPI73461.1 DUF1254 domain-containing protein [Mesorhizobium sp. B3-1-3]
MKKAGIRILIGMSLLLASSVTWAQASPSTAQAVTFENYNRAQTDVYFAGVVKSGGFGKFRHGRELAPPVQQGIVRPNRDTLYSFVIVDLDAGPATITLPDAGRRFMGLQVVNEDQYSRATFYDAGSYTLTRDTIGTRYAIAVVRFLVNYTNKADIEQVHALQDTVQFSQEGTGTFDVPNWDEASLKKVQAALLQLGTTVSDTRRMFGATEDQVDPVKHLIGSAMLWGGAPEKDSLYLPTTPARNDGATIHKLTVGEVPVDGFWSLTVYNKEGYLQPNKDNAYSVNSLTAKKGADGAVSIQFGGCDGQVLNCLPITPGWNYTVRLFRPRAEIIDGRWLFPLARPES